MLESLVLNSRHIWHKNSNHRLKNSFHNSFLMKIWNKIIFSDKYVFALNFPLKEKKKKKTMVTMKQLNLYCFPHKMLILKKSQPLKTI